MKITIRYAHVSIALDIAAAGIGALGGPLNAMTAVIGKRGLETALRQSARTIADWRDPPPPASQPEFVGPRGPVEHGPRARLGHGPAERVGGHELLPSDVAAV